MGYPSNKFTVIPNGFNLEQFAPSQTARQSVCQELDIPKSTMIIGMVARFHPQKDYRTFLRAAQKLIEKVPSVQFVLIGSQVDDNNQELSAWISEMGLGHHVQLLGIRKDIPRLMASFDVFTLSSAFGEGFPNVVGEAMACGVPCVVTDVGDSALLVGKTGIIVPPMDFEQMCAAWFQIFSFKQKKRKDMGSLARARIKKNFSLPDIAQAYSELYIEILS